MHQVADGTPDSSNLAEPPAGGLRGPLRAFWLLASGQSVGQAISFGLLVVVAHEVGPSNLGEYQFAVSALTYFSVFADLGLTSLAVRDVATRRASPRDIAGEVVVLRVTLAALAFGSLLALAPHVAPSHDTAILLSILGLTLIADALAGDWLLQAEQRLGVIALAALSRQVLIAGLTAIVLTKGFAGVEHYVIVIAAAELLLSIGTAFIAVRMTGLPRVNFRLAPLYRRWRRGLPFAWTFVMIQIYYATDSLLLAYFKSTRAVGQYAVAYRLPSVVIGVVSLWSTAVYPYLARRGVRDVRALHSDLSRATGVSLILAAAVIAIALPDGHALMREIFGPSFGAAGPAFVILMANAAVIIVSVNLMNGLLACGDERQYAVAVTVGAVANIVLNVVLIPSMGPAGAATATLAAELIVLLYMGARLRSLMPALSIERDRVVRGLAVAMATACILLVLPGAVPAIVEIPLGCVAFLGLALPLKVVTVDELLVRRTSEHDPP